MGQFFLLQSQPLGTDSVPLFRGIHLTTGDMAASIPTDLSCFSISPIFSQRDFQAVDPLLGYILFLNLKCLKSFF